MWNELDILLVSIVLLKILSFAEKSIKLVVKINMDTVTRQSLTSGFGITFGFSFCCIQSAMTHPVILIGFHGRSAAWRRRNRFLFLTIMLRK
jgi:hypothetical protein